ncbi:MAG: hypothetical protein IJK24_06495 [Oscillospiraceae bacterium]|nr:hypothetical protein [Oscillospiraceae bacterium]
MNNTNDNEKRALMTEAQWYSGSWNYFSLLSGQRMQMLQYFISLEVFLCGSFITLVSLDTRLLWAEITASSLITLMAVIFRGLDHRTKTMLHECEKAMCKIEESDSSDAAINPITSVNSCRKAKLTYTKWIIVLQGLFFLAGIASLLLVLFGII